MKINVMKATVVLNDDLPAEQVNDILSKMERPAPGLKKPKVVLLKSVPMCKNPIRVWHQSFDPRWEFATCPTGCGLTRKCRDWRFIGDAPRTK